MGVVGVVGGVVGVVGFLRGGAGWVWRRPPSARLAPSAPDKACVCDRFFSRRSILGACHGGVRNAARSKEVEGCGLFVRVVTGRVRSDVAITSGK